jgi:death-on-curing protein
VSFTWPDAEDLLTLLAESTGPEARIRDAGILVAVAARPHARLLGRAAYPTVLDKAAALLHGISVWRPLDLWNSGLAWMAVRLLFERHGLPLAMPAKDRMALTDDITAGTIDTVDEIALRLAPFLQLR